MTSLRIPLCALAVLLAALLGSCSGELTEILVVVDSDLAVPMGLDAVRVEVSGAQSMSASGTLTGTDAEPLPRTVGIVYGGGELGPLTVRVVGSVSGRDVVSAQAVTSFVSGKTLVLPMFLSRRCVDVTCDDAETCARGTCASAEVDPATLAEWNGTVTRPDGGGCTAASESCNSTDDDCDGRVDEGFDLATDPMNCGACGTACTGPNLSGTCMDGHCSSACDSGFGDCNGDASDGCETDLSSSEASCGSCGNACTFANAIGVCTASTCSLGACESGFGDCDGDPSDGCEIDLTTTATSCGSCDNACTFANATGVCADSACMLGACDTGFDDCNTDPSDGCEVPLNTLTDCGACGMVCTSPSGSASCATGTCTIDSCDAGLGDCNGDTSDGCETTLDTLADCGACGMACTTANATPTCATGTCAIEACDAGFDDCNGDASDGCEAPLDTVTDCGACGMACTIANGTGTCASGTCDVASCDADRDDCNMDASDGCEANLQSDESNCGSCGMACSSGRTCRNGHCRN